jgi:hypothetical protein
MVTLCMALLAAWACGFAVAQEAGVQPWEGHYTGAVIPTPREFTELDGPWELADARTGKVSACILTSPRATEAERLAAQEIAARISALGGGLTVPIVSEEDLPDAPLFIAVGLVDTSDFLLTHQRRCRVSTPEQPEGYAIACFEHRRGFHGVLLSGCDPAGAYFAAQSLQQLMERQGDRVVLHPAIIRDWPAYGLRSFKTGGGFNPGNPVKQMGQWAPHAKFNCFNICYSTLGKDKWVNPDPGYRELVAELTRFMRARGLDCMPFVNPYYLWAEHIETSDPGDLQKLFEACRIGPDAGGRRVMLCLDDFASEPDKGAKLYHVRSEKDRAKWGDDLAAVNIAMINDLAARMKVAHPDCQLYAVLPYYWTPSGAYRVAGEDYLRAMGKGLDPAVRVVWTGPRVRSAVITAPEAEHYQALLGGRKVMLWDNTLYMHHTPPHYLLDTFHTQYPSQYWELSSGEVHLNAGSGEIYKCGLLAASDALWNPEAYDPERSLRNAVGAVAGPECVDDLLAFRDAFYEVYDQYAQAYGSPKGLLEEAGKMTASPLTGQELDAFRVPLAKEKELAAKLAQTCTNQALVTEIQQRVAMHDGYRQAADALAKLPPAPEAGGVNVIPNPGAEEVKDGRPVGWGLYLGAGKARLSSAPGRDGGLCARIEATEWYPWPDGRRTINVALMIGDSDGYQGTNALSLQPMRRYWFSLWLKGTAATVKIGVVTWGPTGDRESRGGVGELVGAFAAPQEWTHYEGSFLMPAGAARAALKIGIEGQEGAGGVLGEVCVDDVFLGAGRPADTGDRAQP